MPSSRLARHRLHHVPDRQPLVLPDLGRQDRGRGVEGDKGHPDAHPAGDLGAQPRPVSARAGSARSRPIAPGRVPERVADMRARQHGVVGGQGACDSELGMHGARALWSSVLTTPPASSQKRRASEKKSVCARAPARQAAFAHPPGALHGQRLVNSEEAAAQGEHQLGRRRPAAHSSLAGGLGGGGMPSAVTS